MIDNHHPTPLHTTSGAEKGMTVSEIAKIMCTVGSVVKKDDAILFVRKTYGDLENKWTLPLGIVDGRLHKNGEIDTPERAAFLTRDELSAVQHE